MTSRIRIEPKDLELLLQAAAELADLYDLDLVPWQDMITIPTYTLDDDGNEVRIADMRGQLRSTTARFGLVRALHKQMMARMKIMDKKAYNRSKKK